MFYTCLAIFSKSSNHASRPRLSEDSEAQSTKELSHTTNSASTNTASKNIFGQRLDFDVARQNATDTVRYHLANTAQTNIATWFNQAWIRHVPLLQNTSLVIEFKYLGDHINRRGVIASPNNPLSSITTTSHSLTAISLTSDRHPALFVVEVGAQRLYKTDYTRRRYRQSRLLTRESTKSCSLRAVVMDPRTATYDNGSRLSRSSVYTEGRRRFVGSCGTSNS